MASWETFEREQPEMAAAGRRLIYQQGPEAPGYAFLGTVRRDGGPRVHPISPVIAGGGLYAFIVNLGYKYHDLLREPRYALHAFTPPAGGEEFYVTGGASTVTDAAERAAVRGATGGALGNHDFEVLFRFDIERALHTKWENWGRAQTWPTFTKWPGGTR
jgi:Pyridoxamine 5'-phosphate oxidase